MGSVRAGPVGLSSARPNAQPPIPSTDPAIPFACRRGDDHCNSPLHHIALPLLRRSFSVGWRLRLPSLFLSDADIRRASFCGSPSTTLLATSPRSVVPLSSSGLGIRTGQPRTLTIAATQAPSRPHKP